MVPLRIRAAAGLLGVLGVGLFIYTVILTIPLISDPDPMLGLELIVSAILVLGAVGAIVGGLGLIRSTSWARPVAIAVALLLILVSAIFILPNLGTVGSFGPPIIDPLFWVLGAIGLVLLALVVMPYRPAEGG